VSVGTGRKEVTIDAFVSSLRARDEIVHDFDLGPYMGISGDISMRTDLDYRFSSRFNSSSLLSMIIFPLRFQLKDFTS
jgi:hypothetical protein